MTDKPESGAERLEKRLASVGTKPPRFLLVEDDDHDLQHITHALVEAGCEVVAVKTGEIALEQIRAGGFDIIAIDLHMPGINGVDVIRGVKSLAPKTVIVIVTGSDKEDPLLKEALALSPVTVKQKPLASEDVKELLQHLNR